MLVTVLAMALPAQAARGDVVRVVIDRRDTLAGGRAWGEAGPYERLVGRIYFAFDPDDPANAGIAGIDRAPRNADGRVEASAAFVAMQPVDPGRRSGVAWLEVLDRGRASTLRALQRGTGAGPGEADGEGLGDGLLLRRGWTLIWVGWQWDLADDPDVLTLDAPRVRGAGTGGPVRVRWVVAESRDTLPLTGDGTAGYLPVDPSSEDHELRVRTRWEEEASAVPREAWRFVPGPRGEPRGIVVDGGFETGHVYDLVYRSSGSRVSGLGLAVVRDVMAHAKFGLESPFPARVGLAFGVRGGGSFLRAFLHGGFNVDERGRRVFDGVFIHGAGAIRGGFNRPFGRPAGDDAVRPALRIPLALHPFAVRSPTDPGTGEVGLLEDTPEEGHPRIFQVNTGRDYWRRGASLLHAAPDPPREVPLAEVERVYHLAGGGGWGGGPHPAAEARGPGEELEAARAAGELAVDPTPTLRALALALEAWVVDDQPPPPSSHPRLSEGTLVPPRAVAYPALPGLARSQGEPSPEETVGEDGAGAAGPSAATTLPVRVSQVDALGNEVAGVRGVELRVPLATHLPGGAPPLSLDAWSGAGRGPAPLLLPLPRTEADRRRLGDPRPSLELLYGDRTGFMRHVVAAVAALTEAGFLLPEDAGVVSGRAARSWDALVGGG